MSTAVILKDVSVVAVRGPGDGMETDEPPVAPELSVEAPLLKMGSPKPSPRAPVGVLHLGEVSRDACAELEAVRIVAPWTAISRSPGPQAMQHGDECPPSPSAEPLDRSALDKLQNSERRLLQDTEGLSNQLRVQTEVNRELKKLLVASVGDDLQYHFERVVREKNQLLLELEALSRSLSQTAEQLERTSIQCDVWRSKFLASRVMSQEVSNARAALQRQTRDAQCAIQDLLRERDALSTDMMLTHRCLEQLLVSLQWGRPQTDHPSAQPLSTAELATANHKLADAISSQLLGNEKKSPRSERAELCTTPAERMAEKVLRSLDPISCSEKKPDPDSSASDPLHSPFLAGKKSTGRFHPYTRYENITFSCCERCSGEIIVL
uniref:Basic leucine zipper nuclear factor 1 n=1 Tax=Cyprinus carpio TaxID=7962 RepID=A0A8C2KI81_CYPCA